MVLVNGLALYVIAGVCTAIAFVGFGGVTRVLTESMPVTVGARILVLPGAAVLWPYVLYRWITSEHRR